MGRRVTFKGIYGFGKTGGNLQGMSTRNHHWKVMRGDLRKRSMGYTFFWNEKSGWEEDYLLKTSMDLGKLEKICKEGPHTTTIGK